jgi:hypothetical protein
MNKRSAMFVAAGLVLTMIVAGLAMAMGVTGPSADAKTTARQSKPIVHTTTRTVTVHKQAKGTDNSGTVIFRTSPSTGTSTSSSDDQFESDSTSDDQFESEDSGSEDQSSTDSSSTEVEHGDD